MPPIFDYSSRTFTIMAIIFLMILVYLSHKDNTPTVESNYVEKSSTENSEKTFFDKVLLLIFKDDISRPSKSN
jgi:hypothetical protein